MKSLYILAAYIVIASLFSEAYCQGVTKEKKIAGRFSADRGKLVIDNRYGKLDVHTWDRNEVTVDITITAEARSANDAQEILDRVSISEPQDKSTGIYYKTEIAKEKSQTGGKYQINYIINMPRRHTAEFVNKYGDIGISDVDGKLNIDLEYGDLKTAAIRGNDKVIKVGFGSATIASIESGTIRCSYSKLSIDKAGSIEVSNQFEKTTVNSVRNLNIDQKYGDLKIGSVNQLKGNVQYAGLFVDKLLKSAQMTLKYSTGTKFENVGPDVNNINITSSFSNLYFHFDNEASLSADVDISFGNLNNSAHNVSLATLGSGMPGQVSTYKGKIGNGRGNLMLQVSYGNVVVK